ncbi:CLUMA_CG007000, isoform A [Clunio marinus]|uniref:Ataxin-10 n=1 Tax=Clunio marinus TaxID=568069 RepID=A0A1J1HZD4_9DIPT|nr:CLUMA_CG007000, isoform A [Clunio marinus]
MDYHKIIEEIKKFSKTELDVAEMEDSTIFVSKNFIQMLIHHNNDYETQKGVIDELIIECIKHLKIMCTKGPSFQNLIVNTNLMLQMLKNVISNKFPGISKDQELKCFQLIANLCVKNEWSQKKIWESMSGIILDNFRSENNPFVTVSGMIIYNTILSKASLVNLKYILQISLRHYSSFLKNPKNSLPDFVQIILSYVVSGNEDILEIYKELESDEQKILLYYIHDHIEDPSNEIINKNFLQHLTMEFKKKSDCILKTVTTYVDTIDPDIIVTLLDIISIATGQDNYLQILKDDRALFLNLGCLLQALHKIGKKSDTIFSPIQKLESLVPTSDVDGNFEKQISYAFKTKLVKSLANLSYRNKRNQELAREMEIMLSIFECTNADARNPLIKEWSILAIRNLCDDNLENQEIVRQLTKVGDAENPVLKELGLESGMLRISKQ